MRSTTPFRIRHCPSSGCCVNRPQKVQTKRGRSLPQTSIRNGLSWNPRSIMLVIALRTPRNGALGMRKLHESFLQNRWRRDIIA